MQEYVLLSGLLIKYGCTLYVLDSVEEHPRWDAGGCFMEECHCARNVQILVKRKFCGERFTIVASKQGRCVS